MNVFILCTGRSGSRSFIEACRHISNFSSSHESRTNRLFHDRLNYPSNHIEADNRLSWILGRLDKAYGDTACYVHLKRDSKNTAQSFKSRWGLNSIITAYTLGILMRKKKDLLCIEDYIETVNSNIDLFLQNKSRKMVVNLETIENDFSDFWDFIQAEGDKPTAIKTLKTPTNTTREQNSLIYRIRKNWYELRCMLVWLKN